MDSDKLNELLLNLNTVNPNNDQPIPPWALLFLESFKVLIGEIKKLNDSTIRIGELEDRTAVCENTSDRLITEIKRLGDELKKLQEKVDDQEQRSRNNCLLLHGVEENMMQQDTDGILLNVINNDLGLTNITIEDIQRSHRLGPFKKDQRNLRSARKNPRPIIMRFSSWRDRQKVFKAKRNLKGKKISISENLTQHRLSQCHLSRSHQEIWLR